MRTIDLEPWKLGACPMSTAAITAADTGVLIAWQGEQGLRWARVTQGKAEKPIALPPGTSAKHPSIAQSADGTIAVVWTEGTGWNKGGSLHWQLYDKTGATVGAPGKQDGVPFHRLGYQEYGCADVHEHQRYK